MRRGLLALILLLALAAPAQAAGPSIPSAKRAIAHWWLDRQHPVHILWCSRKHNGTLCGLRIWFGQTGVFGREDDWVWIVQKHHHLRVSDLGQVIYISPTQL